MRPPGCYKSTDGLVQLRNFPKLQKEEDLKEKHLKEGSSKLVFSAETFKFF